MFLVSGGFLHSLAVAFSRRSTSWLAHVFVQKNIVLWTVSPPMETAHFIDAILAGFLTTNLLWLSRFPVDTRHSFEDQTQMSTFRHFSRRPISRYSDFSLSSSVALFALYDFLGHVSFSTLPTLFAHPDFKIKNTNCYRAISQVFTIKSNMIASFKPLNLLFLTLPWSSTCISGLSIANTCMSEQRSHSFNLGIKHFARNPQVQHVG